MRYPNDRIVTDNHLANHNFRCAPHTQTDILTDSHSVVHPPPDSAELHKTTFTSEIT